MKYKGHHPEVRMWGKVLKIQEKTKYETVIMEK